MHRSLWCHSSGLQGRAACVPGMGTDWSGVHGLAVTPGAVREGLGLRRREVTCLEAWCLWVRLRLFAPPLHPLPLPLELLPPLGTQHLTHTHHTHHPLCKHGTWLRISTPNTHCAAHSCVYTCSTDYLQNSVYQSDTCLF